MKALLIALILLSDPTGPEKWTETDPNCVEHLDDGSCRAEISVINPTGTRDCWSQSTENGEVEFCESKYCVSTAEMTPWSPGVNKLQQCFKAACGNYNGELVGDCGVP